MSTLVHVNTLMLVDDDPSMLRLLERIIERSFGGRMKVYALTDPDEARRCLERNQVDILVTDLEMPGIDGLELLRHAKRRNPCAQVLFVTGHSTIEALAEAMEAGATDYLLKPLDQAELVALVADAEKRLRRWQEALAATVDCSRAL